MTATWLVRRHRLIFFAGLYVAYLLTLLHVAPHTTQPAHLLIQGLASAMELALGWIACSRLHALSSPRIRWTEPLYLGLALVLGLIYAAQMYSLYLSGNFITVLAIENRAESWIIRRGLVTFALLPILLWWCLFAFARRYERRLPAMPPDSRGRDRWRVPQRIATVSSIAALAWLFHAQRHHDLLQADYHQAPLTAFSRTLYDASKNGLFDHWLPIPRQTKEPLENASGYPLEKSTVYTNALPFHATDAVDTPPNVIVLFLEGTSTRLIGAYGGTHAGLTPAMDRLAARSMRVTHYYNHTAATYRGLQGQLVSGYPAAGGDDDHELWESEQSRQRLSTIRYRSLPMMLRENGYHTYFMSPHHDSVGLNTMLRALGFDKVYSFEDVSQRIAPGNPFYAVEGALSDHDEFHALQLLLSKHMLGDQGHPFFLGLYNFGTHAFLDIMPIGVKYQDGSNASLNKLHNLDDALGRFLDYFFASPYASNTILILTADHATYPERSYRDIAGEGFQPLFVDTIPLLVYDPTHRLPNTYDAQGRTSLDLAPTLLHLLGIQRGNNSFMGTSLFEPDGKALSVAAIGNEFFGIDRDGVHTEAHVPAPLRQAFDHQKRDIQSYYGLEQANRLVAPITQAGGLQAALPQ